MFVVIFGGPPLRTNAMQKDFISVFLPFTNIDRIWLLNSNLIGKKFDSLIFMKISQNIYENKCETKCTKIKKKYSNFTEIFSRK